MLGVRSVAIVLVDEVVVFLSLPLQCLLTPINVGWYITLDTRKHVQGNKQDFVKQILQ